jgi:predicted  nucleic acid-binding Zn-ribbon protein
MSGLGVIVHGKPRDLFLQRVINLLLVSDEKSSIIRQCPKCGTFFFKVRRQKYCSRYCVLAANKKDWLDKQREAREKEQAARSTKAKKRGRKK